jgi:hypothetical protein
MNEQEKKILSLIHSSEDTSVALSVALKLVLGFLELPQASECMPLEPQPEVS